MSFTINVAVKDGTAVVASQSIGEAAPPDGSFTISGHVGTEWSSVGVTCPVGSASAYINHTPITSVES